MSAPKAAVAPADPSHCDLVRLKVDGSRHLFDLRGLTDIEYVSAMKLGLSAILADEGSPLRPRIVSLLKPDDGSQAH